MTFEEILDHAIAMLQRRGRLTYGTLKRQFELDDAALDDLKTELIEGQRLAVDERGTVRRAGRRSGWGRGWAVVSRPHQHFAVVVSGELMDLEQFLFKGLERLCIQMELERKGAVGCAVKQLGGMWKHHWVYRHPASLWS